MAARRNPVDAPNKIGLYPGWAWAWPANRRILYNRASLSPTGQPWNPRRWVIRWNAQDKKWEGDVPDGGGPPEAINPFIMTTSGLADLFAPGLADGPFPEHYRWWRPVSRILWGLVLAAVVTTIVRFATGIATIANINQAYPWGWWVGFDMLTRIALGGVGFTMAAAGEIFDVKGLRHLVRAALLLGLLWYLTYAIVLMVELGRPWMIWMVFLSWAPTSAMYEVALCAVAYTTVLVLEFSPLVLARLGWTAPVRRINAVYLLIVVTGVSLSSLHQSSLGTLLLLLPTKVHPLWHSELLPVFFLFSAIMAGPALMLIEHPLATHFLRRQPRMDALRSLGRILTVLIAAYLVLRLGDVLYRGESGAALSFGFEARWFWLEILVGLLVPLALLLVPGMDENKWGLCAAGTCVLVGIVLNRLNAAVITMKVHGWETYRPAVTEVLISVGAVAGMVLAYVYLIRWLPIHTEPPLPPESAVASTTVRAVS